MNKKTALKVVAVSGLIWSCSELAFILGKGNMLGIIIKYNYDKEQTNELMEALIKDKRLRCRLIGKVAKDKKTH